MSFGLQWLQKTFGTCARPRSGWGIDTAGHSLTHVEVLAKMGFDSFFFERIDFQDYRQRAENKELEMIWKSQNKGLEIQNKNSNLSSFSTNKAHIPNIYALNSETHT